MVQKPSVLSHLHTAGKSQREVGVDGWFWKVTEKGHRNVSRQTKMLQYVGYLQPLLVIFRFMGFYND